MDIGMLWIDEGQGRDLASRVREAVASYEAQYGVAPSLCLLNPDQMDENAEVFGGLRLEANPSLLPNYFWIGRTTEQSPVV